MKQELLFVGQESGKLIAIRDIIGKVNLPDPVTAHVTAHATNHATNHVTDHVNVLYPPTSGLHSSHAGVCAEH